MTHSRTHVPWRRGVATTAFLAAGATALSTGLLTDPGRADAAPASAANAAGPSTQAVEAVTVRPDPTYAGKRFEGWGTSLVWFANATGDYPAPIKNRLADLVFGEDGLNLNIARYNIGGGNAPDVQDYLRKGGAVDGWWRAPAGTTREDTDWWDADDPADWDEDADATQRWWVDRVKDRVTHWETFSNSPPWFQTVSGYVSGGFDSSDEQLREDRVEDFAAYVAGVTERLEKAHRIKVRTVDPLNEPNTPYWGTKIGDDGEPVGGRQEGAHVGPEMQARLLKALAAELRTSSTKARISAMDETNPTTFARNWRAYDQQAKDVVSQLNVHTYGTGGRTTARDVAKAADKPLWMSEVEGSWGEGQSFTDMAPGLGMARHIADDLRELEPAAWVFWQPVEDYDNMAPGGESEKGMNWGSIQLPFDCGRGDTLRTCPIRTNTKFDTVRNFTHFIRPGDRLIGVDDTDSAAAMSRDGASVVHVNDRSVAREVTLDLSGFRLARGARVTPVTSSADGALQRGRSVAVRGEEAVLRVPARSVTTFEVSGVRGVDRGSAAIQRGEDYTLTGVGSGKALTAEDGRLVVRTADAGAAQEWRLHRVGKARGDDRSARYEVRRSGSREVVVAQGDGVTTARGATGARARWILSTTGDGTWTLVNDATGDLLEVGGQATAEGSPVALWEANSGSNQRWAIAPAD